METSDADKLHEIRVRVEEGIMYKPDIERDALEFVLKRLAEAEAYIAKLPS